MDEKIAEIEKLMNDLFKKLDALSHFRYIPAEVNIAFFILNSVVSFETKKRPRYIISCEDCQQLRTEGPYHILLHHFELIFLFFNFSIC